MSVDANNAAEATNVEPAAAANAGEANETPVTIEQLMATNARLLEESRANKKAAQEYKKTVEQIELEKKKSNAEFEKLYKETESKYSGLKKQLMVNTVSSAVKEAALKAGCQKPDALLKLGDASMLEFDEESLSVNGVEMFIESVKKDYPEFFSAPKGATINTTRPGVTPPQVVTADNFGSMNKKQQMEAFEAALQAKLGK